jgi:acyl carrier protein
MNKPALLQQLHTWRTRGVTVLAQACDVADESQVRELIGRIDESVAPLAGVIHAAAGLRFSPILESTSADVDYAFRAKVIGARMLDRCTRQHSLDFFVLFGSAAAALGLRNGALYAAANSSLEGIVAERHALGLPALCVEWGSWEQQDGDEQRKLVDRSGFMAMPVDRAMQALGELIVSRHSTRIVADIDWNVLGPAFEMRGRQALVAEIIGEPEPSQRTEDHTEEAWLEELRKLPPRERRHSLLDFVGAEVRRIFGMLPQDALDENRGLFQLGMDSLMSVRLKRRLEAATGLRLPGTLTLTYPTIAALAQHLEEKLFPSGAVKTNTADSQAFNRKRRVSTSVAEMDESETNAAIADEIAAIRQKLGVL